MAADPEMVAWLKDAFPAEELDKMRHQAGMAAISRKTEYQITATTYEGGTTTMERAGDPRDFMEECRVAKEELAEAAATNPGEVGNLGNPAINFSRRVVRT